MVIMLPQPSHKTVSSSSSHDDDDEDASSYMTIVKCFCRDLIHSTDCTQEGEENEKEENGEEATTVTATPTTRTRRRRRRQVMGMIIGLTHGVGGHNDSEKDDTIDTNNDSNDNDNDNKLLSQMDGCLVLDDGTGVVRLRIPPHIQRTLSHQWLPGLLADCVVVVTPQPQQSDISLWTMESISLWKQPSDDGLLWLRGLEIQQQQQHQNSLASNTSTTTDQPPTKPISNWYYPLAPSLTLERHVYEIIASTTGVALPDLCRVLGTTSQLKVQGALQQLQLHGQVYLNQDGLYMLL